MSNRRSIALIATVAAAAWGQTSTLLAVSWNATVPADSAISTNGFQDQPTLFVDENIVNDTANSTRGTGTYLGDGWVLSAQHVITGSGNVYGTNASPSQINYNVIVGGVSQDYTADMLMVNGSADLSLIHLADATSGPITTLPGVLDSAIYGGSSEANTLVQLGGFGYWGPLAGTLNSGEVFNRAFNVVASTSGAFANVTAQGNSILVNNNYLMGIGESGDSGSGLWLDTSGNNADTNLWDYSLAGELNTNSNGNAFGSNNQYERTSAQYSFITSTAYADHLTVFWDANSSEAGIQDGSGIWNTTNTNFGNGISNFAWDNGATTDNAFFGAHQGAAGIVTLGANISVDNMQFNPATTGTYTIAGSGSFALSFAATSTIASNANATISAPMVMPSGVDLWPTSGNTLTLSGNISGSSSSGTIYKFGQGVVTLSGTNTFAGTLKVGNGATSGGNVDGALRIASDGALNGLSTVDLTDNNGAWGVLQFDGTTANGNLTVPSAGSVGITLNGNNAGPAATATTIIENIGGSNVFTGAISGTTGGIGYGIAVDAGSLTLNSLTTTTSKILYFRGPGDGSFSGVISGASVGVNQTDSGTWTLNSANTYGLATTLAGGVLSTNRLANGGVASGIGDSSNAAGNLVLTGGTLSYDGSGASTNRLFTIGPRGGTIDGSGTGALNFSQSGSAVSSDAATHAATTVSGSNVVTITAGGETDLAIGMPVTGTGIPGGATITGFSDDAGTITISAAATASGSPTLSFGAENRTLTLTGSTAVSNTLTPSLANSAGGAALGLTKTGIGTWALSGTNTYTGPTVVSNGALVIAAAGALPSGANVTNNASLDVNANSAAGNISGTGGTTVATNVALTANNFTQANLVNNGTAQINGSGTVGPISGSGTLILGNGSANTLQLSNSSGGSAMGSLSIANATGSALDITNNHVIINYGSNADPNTTILGYLSTGSNDGNWNGPGIVSSVAAANTNYGVGYSDGADGVDPNLTSGQIEVAYAQYGDITLQGIVNGQDFSILASNFGQVVTNGWESGDFLYTGTVNAEDFSLLAQNFGLNGSGEDIASEKAAIDAFAAANGLAVPNNVPEPVGLTGVAALGVLSRRRRFRAINPSGSRH